MKTPRDRIDAYPRIAHFLGSLKDDELIHLIQGGNRAHQGIGGSSSCVDTSHGRVFFKQVPLTDLELSLEYKGSTANVFKLPLHYQYGVGSAGFGAWRELESHLSATDWVLEGHCPNFPLLYHWRVLANEGLDTPPSYWDNVDDYCQYWDNSAQIKQRVMALQESSYHILLCLEYIPCHLYAWLSDKLKRQDDTTDQALEFVERSLLSTVDFMQRNHMIHFDAHFENLLTDGELIYFSDFGLALSKEFQLNAHELEFFNQHSQYDEASIGVNLMHTLVSSKLAQDKYNLPDALKTIQSRDLGYSDLQLGMIDKYTDIALLMDNFYVNLQQTSKSTPYPREEIEKTLIELG